MSSIDIGVSARTSAQARIARFFPRKARPEIDPMA